MGWLRAHRRIAGAVALLALALQLVASFAHVHAPARADVAAVVTSGTTPTATHDDEKGAGGAPRGQLCDICATLAIGEGGQIAFPPALVPPPLAAPTLPTVADVLVFERRHSPAQSRAPPTA